MVEKYVVNAGDNNTLSLFCIPKQGFKSGYVEIYKNNSLFHFIRVDSPNGWKYDVAVKNHEDFEIMLEDTSIPFAYFWSNDFSVIDKGIEFIDFHDKGKCYSYKNISICYDQPCRNMFHFSTIRNWMNDPNGLCFDGSRIHLFYQMNPFSKKWGNPYWGHAVSSDLTHWKHLPVALSPQLELKYDTEHKGGAYSGCAWCEKGEMNIYFTRCFSPFIRDASTKEFQVHALCNGVSINDEEVIIKSHPLNSGVDFNFRDPKIVSVDGRILLLLASTINGVCSVLVYEKNNDGWQYLGNMFQDANCDCLSFECVNLIKDKNSNYCAVIISLQDSPEKTGLRRRMVAYIGKLYGIHLEIETIKPIDFGTGSYAMQTFEYLDNTIGFSWVLDTYNEFDHAYSWSNGAISLPVRCILNRDDLRFIPFEGIYKLAREYTSKPLNPNYFWHMEFCEYCEFNLIFAENREKLVGLSFKDKKLVFLYGKKNSCRQIELSIQCDLIDEIEIFVDKAVVEVFANNGKIYGIKPYCIPFPENYAKSWFKNEASVIVNEIRMLDSIWK